MQTLDKQYWNQRYNDGQTGWDIGSVSAPLKAYFDQLDRKDEKILIPGCGFGYEGIYARSLGFEQTFLLDFSPIPKKTVLSEHPGIFPSEQWFVEDFFDHKGQYDLIIEQTLFCAIDPRKRSDYAKKTAELLLPGGKLVGLLFNRDFESGPPFGGTKVEYMGYFSPYFSNLKMTECYNSIEPRRDSELFIQLTK